MTSVGKVAKHVQRFKTKYLYIFSEKMLNRIEYKVTYGLLIIVVLISGCTTEKESKPEIGNFSVSQERSGDFVYTYNCKRDKSSL